MGMWLGCRFSIEILALDSLIVQLWLTAPVRLGIFTPVRQESLSKNAEVYQS